ncbi:hypothetical protein DIPPA_22854 [Diplonema papillatum]|nr:hypothetical protein DIPPA_22854 [Diplonema papillatum]
MPSPSIRRNAPTWEGGDASPACRWGGPRAASRSPSCNYNARLLAASESAGRAAAGTPHRAMRCSTLSLPRAYAHPRERGPRDSAGRRSASAHSYFLSDYASLCEERDGSVAFGLQLLATLRLERRRHAAAVAALEQRLIVETAQSDEVRKERNAAVLRVAGLAQKHNEAIVQRACFLEELEAARAEIASVSHELALLRASKPRVVVPSPLRPAAPARRGSGDDAKSPKRFTFYDTIDFSDTRVNTGTQATPLRKTKAAQTDAAEPPATVVQQVVNVIAHREVSPGGGGGECSPPASAAGLRADNEALRAEVNRQASAIHRLERRAQALADPPSPTPSFCSPDAADKLGSLAFHRYSPSVVFGSQDVTLTLAQEMQMLEDQDALVDEETAERAGAAQEEHHHRQGLENAFLQRLLGISAAEAGIAVGREAAKNAAQRVLLLAGFAAAAEADEAAGRRQLAVDEEADARALHQAALDEEQSLRVGMQERLRERTTHASAARHALCAAEARERDGVADSEADARALHQVALVKEQSLRVEMQERLRERTRHALCAAEVRERDVVAGSEADARALHHVALVKEQSLRVGMQERLRERTRHASAARHTLCAAEARERDGVAGSEADARALHQVALVEEQSLRIAIQERLRERTRHAWAARHALCAAEARERDGVAGSEADARALHQAALVKEQSSLRAGRQERLRERTRHASAARHALGAAEARERDGVAGSEADARALHQVALVEEQSLRIGIQEKLRERTRHAWAARHALCAAEARERDGVAGSEADARALHRAASDEGHSLRAAMQERLRSARAAGRRVCDGTACPGRRAAAKSANEAAIFISGLLDAATSDEASQRAAVEEHERGTRLLLERVGEGHSPSALRLAQKHARESIEFQHRKFRMETQRHREVAAALERSHACQRTSVAMREQAEREAIRDAFREGKPRQPKPARTARPNLSASLQLSSVFVPGDQPKDGGVAANPEFLNRMMRAAQKERQKTGHKPAAAPAPAPSAPEGRWAESPTRKLGAARENSSASRASVPAGCTVPVHCDGCSPSAGDDGRGPSSAISSIRASSTRSYSTGRDSSSVSLARETSRRSRTVLSALPNGFSTPALVKNAAARSRTPTQGPIVHWAYDSEHAKEWTQLRESVLHATPSMGVKIAQIHESKDKEGIFKVAHQTLKAILADALKDRTLLPGRQWGLGLDEIDRIPRHARNAVLRALRDIVCAYDMMKQSQRDSLLTVQEIQTNIASLILLSRWSQRSFYNPSSTRSRSQSQSMSRTTSPASARSRSTSPGFSIGKHSTFIAC